jgi:hypothetical protein
LLFLTVILVFWDMIFNQENYVHETALVCKKTDTGYVGFFYGGDVFAPDCRIRRNAVENKQDLFDRCMALIPIPRAERLNVQISPMDQAVSNIWL